MSENPYQPPNAGQRQQRNHALIWLVALVAFAVLLCSGLVCSGVGAWFLARPHDGAEVERLEIPDGPVVPQPAP